MSGSLVKIAETTVSSAVSAVVLTGISSTYKVYKLVMNNVSPATLNADVHLRFTESGTASSDSDYDYALHQIRDDTSFSDVYATNEDAFTISGSLDDEAGKTFNGFCYIFCAPISNEYTFISVENSYHADGEVLLGNQGCGVYTQDTVVDGVSITLENPSSNIDSGTFKIFGIKND